MCREHAAEFRPHQKALKDLGIKLVFISTGLPAMADDFIHTMQLSSEVWVDPDRRTYRHLGFVHSRLALLDPRTYANTLRAFQKGFRQGKAQGDVHQQGGVVVVRQGGEAVYGYASKVPGDMPDTGLVLRKAREAAGRS